MASKTSGTSIIIPNWNGKNLLEKHLKEVIELSGEAQIIVVDDASTDGSVEFIEKQFPSVVLIKRTLQGGFASAVNDGVRHSNGDIVVLLNTDIEPTKTYLEQLLQHFSDPQVFAVGCLDRSMEDDKVVLRGRGIMWWENGYPTHKRGEINGTDTAWVSGGSGAFRKSIWNILGGMDELFTPFYWEDIDISYRARKAGYTVLFEPKSVVIHEHEEGAIKRNYPASYIKEIAFRNQLIFIWKNITDKKLLLSHIFWLPYTCLRPLLSGDIAFIKGYFQAVCRLIPILTKRRSIAQFHRVSDQKLLSL